MKTCLDCKILYPRKLSNILRDKKLQKCKIKWAQFQAWFCEGLWYEINNVHIHEHINFLFLKNVDDCFLFGSVYSPSHKVPSHLKWSQASKMRHKAKSPRYSSSSQLLIRHDTQFRRKRQGWYEMFYSDSGEFFLHLCTTDYWLDGWAFVLILLWLKWFALNPLALLQPLSICS